MAEITYIGGRAYNGEVFYSQKGLERLFNSLPKRADGERVISNQPIVNTYVITMDDLQGSPRSLADCVYVINAYKNDQSSVDYKQYIIANRKIGQLRAASDALDRDKKLPDDFELPYSVRGVIYDPEKTVIGPKKKLKEKGHEGQNSPSSPADNGQDGSSQGLGEEMECSDPLPFTPARCRPKRSSAR